MKTKHWLLLFGAVLLLCAAVLFLLPRRTSAQAEIWSEGELVRTVDLSQDQTFTIRSAEGENTIVVQDGGIRVSEASCPDQVCVRQGACSGGAPIVCLPNQLVIRFSGVAALDGISG